MVRGRYELTGGPETILTARTNALVLESLAYQVEGKLRHGSEENRLFKIEVKNPRGSIPVPMLKRSTGRSSEH